MKIINLLTTMPYHDSYATIIGKLPFFYVQMMMLLQFSTKYYFNQSGVMFVIRPFSRQNSLIGFPLLLRILLLNAPIQQLTTPLYFSELRVKCKRLYKIDYQSCISKTEKIISHNPFAFWKFTKVLKKRATIPFLVH